jgi:multiple sugar transport system permease protein
MAQAIVSRGPVRSRTTRLIGQGAAHVILIALSVTFMLPFVWMVSSSLKPEHEIFLIPPTIIPREFRLLNYPEAVNSINFFGFLLNTLKYVFFATIGAVLCNPLIGYGFSRIDWRGRDAVFILVIATMMLPFSAYFGNPYLIFLMRQFMMTLPVELDDAARIDGCNELGTFWRIMLPLCKPAITVVALNEMLFTWNNFMGPLIYLRDPKSFTLSVGLQLYFTQHGAEWALLMAAGTLFTLPMIIVFFFAQRTFIEGITLTGIKG